MSHYDSGMMHLGSKNTDHPYKLNNMLILPKVIIKDLGINIVNDLSWRSHISIIVKKAHRICNTIRLFIAILSCPIFDNMQILQ